VTLALSEIGQCFCSEHGTLADAACSADAISLTNSTWSFTIEEQRAPPDSTTSSSSTTSKRSLYRFRILRAELQVANRSTFDLELYPWPL
jgi:hypothetical protein